MIGTEHERMQAFVAAANQYERFQGTGGTIVLVSTGPDTDGFYDVEYSSSSSTTEPTTVKVRLLALTYHGQRMLELKEGEGGTTLVSAYPEVLARLLTV